MGLLSVTQQMTGKTTDRIHFIDYIRGFMVLLVVADHAMHAYAPHFKKEFYLQDFGGELFFDIWHMHNDVIMMPMLFFLAGMFVLPSLMRRGLKSFLIEKTYRLVIPFCVGVALLVPPQVYFSKLAKNAISESMSYTDWWFTMFFGEHLWASAFWFLFVLLVYSLFLVLLNAVVPQVVRALGRMAQWMIDNPIKGVVVVCLYSAAVVSFSEIAFGRFDFNMTKYLGFVGKFIKLRQSRVIMEFSFFMMGAGFAQAGITRNKEALAKFGNSLGKWALFALLSGAGYITYSLMNFYEGAYSLEIARHFYFEGTWAEAWPLIEIYGGPIVTRTIMLGVFLIALAGFYMAIFQKVLDKPHAKWQNLAVCSFGIYVFHETIVVALQYYLLNDDINNYLKFLIVVIPSIFVSWILTHVLRGLPGFRRVL